jgi:hypothetical protein
VLDSSTDMAWHAPRRRRCRECQANPQSPPTKEKYPDWENDVLTLSEQRSILEGRLAYERGEWITLEELDRELERPHRQARPKKSRKIS